MGDIDTKIIFAVFSHSYRIAGKSDGELNLAVWWSRLKLPNKTSANIILHTMCKDAMHAVVLLAPLGGPLPKLYM